MIGLISTPSTCARAEHERRHEVAAAAGADDERGEAGRLPRFFERRYASAVSS